MTRLFHGAQLLVRWPSWLGDLVMAEPTLASLAEALNTGRLGGLSFAGPSRFHELFAGRFPGARFLEERRSWAGHDAALLLDGSLRSTWRAVCAGIGERWTWSTGGRGLLATGGFRPALERGGTPLHLGRRGRRPRRLPRPFGTACAELAGVLGVPVIERAPRLEASPAGLGAARERLAGFGLEEGAAYLVLDASARPGSAKGAPPALWAAVIEGLGELPVLVLTAPGEEETARRVLSLARGGSAQLVDDPPPSLAELLTLIAGSRLFLGTDSGPRHLAVATGREAVILFGPTDPRHTADHLEGTTSLRLPLDCSPCHRERCPLPGGERGACLARIEPQSILSAIASHLEQ